MFRQNHTSQFSTLLPKYTESYRYGFNGQRKDNEIYGEGNSYTAEFWQYDPRLGRRWNLDPKSNFENSGYSTFLNNPITFLDRNGDTTEYYDSNSGEYLGTINDNARYGIALMKKESFNEIIAAATVLSITVHLDVAVTFTAMAAIDAQNNDYQRIDWTTTKRVTETYSPYAGNCHEAARDVQGGTQSGPTGDGAAHVGSGDQPKDVKVVFSGLETISVSIGNKKPVLLGLDYKASTNDDNAAYDENIDHYVTGVAIGADAKGAYILVTDNASQNISKDMDKTNRFYIRTNDKLFITGNTNFTRGMISLWQDRKTTTVNYVLPRTDYKEEPKTK